MNDQLNINNDIAYFLRVEGINYKGFGVLPKYVMLDPELTIEAKGIYAYFCSFAGNGNNAFPRWQTITSHLQQNKDTYYKHLKMLTEQGYISIKQKRSENALFSHNIYTLVSNPKKFSETPENNKNSMLYSRIRFSGLKSAGYGLIPKAVMIDERLPIKAKGIYAYFCSFTGSGNNAFPKFDNILNHLHISRQAYYKYYNILVNLNYITAVQRHIDGRLSINDYYLNDMPNILNASKKTILFSTTQSDDFSESVISESAIQSDDFSEADKQEADKQEAEISEYNINSFNINSYYNHQSINQQAAKLLEPAKPEPIDGLNKQKAKFIVMTELHGDKVIPYWYAEDKIRITEAIHYMTDWNIFSKDNSDEFQKSVFILFNNALIDMCCCTEEPIKVKGKSVKYYEIIDKINELAEFTEEYISIDKFKDTAMIDYEKGNSKGNISNPLNYMISCIWNAMQSGHIGMLSQINKIVNKER